MVLIMIISLYVLNALLLTNCMRNDVLSNIVVSSINGENQQNDLYFDQILNHNHNSSEKIYFKQRYYKITPNSTQSLSSSLNKNVTLLYLGGEGELSYSSLLRGYVSYLSNKYNAVLYGLEHRFYGKSIPKINRNSKEDNELGVSRLEYLSVEYSLMDISYFVRILKLKNVVVIGGSYSATLAAYSKITYPELFIGAYSSSPPLIAKRDFYEYELSVQEAIGDKCLHQINKLREYIDHIYEHKELESIKNMFNASQLSNNKVFLFTLGDLLAHLVQYDTNLHKKLRYSKLCKKLLGTAKTTTINYVNKNINQEEYQIKNKLLILSDHYNNLLKNLNLSWLQFSGYNELFKSSNISSKDAMRQWNYQCCTQFGFWQTVPSPDSNSVTSPILPKSPQPYNSKQSRKFLSTRSKYLTVSIIEKLYCSKLIYTKFIGPPETENLNSKYPLSNTSLFRNVIIVNGKHDPWSKLSLTDRSRDSFITPVILNESGSHCSEFAYPTKNDSMDMKYTRARIEAALDFMFSQDG